MHISTLPSTFYTSIPAATFDIQNPLVKPISHNTIGISLEFINDSYARGCLLVAHDAIANEDSFFVLKRHGSNQTMFETVVVLAGKYEVYVYDLEDTWLPNSHPANIAPQVLTVNGSCKFSVFPNMQHVVDVFHVRSRTSMPFSLNTQIYNQKFPVIQKSLLLFRMGQM